jgi:Ca-activated chloride channel homolog
MARRTLLFAVTFTILVSGPAAWLAAQKAPADTDSSVIRVDVDLVQMNVAVTDKKGQYVTNLRPEDFQIVEDGVQQQMATFEEGNEAPRNLLASASSPAGPKTGPIQTSQLPEAPESQDPFVGASVFILFDSSDYMYKDFAFAQDAMVSFVRTLDSVDRVAFYSYSRDFSRSVALTDDRLKVLRGMHTVAAGDDAALYGAMLLTLQDASHYPGRKVMVVFSHGPDNASMVSPEEVGELAQSEGVPIYMVSTRATKLDPISTTVFERMSATTGGEAYFAKNWQDEQVVFKSIREDLAHIYTLSYYPRPNPNRGWRTIKVKLVGGKLKSLNIRTRNGYRPKAARTPGNQSAAAPGQ